MRYQRLTHSAEESSVGFCLGLSVRVLLESLPLLISPYDRDDFSGLLKRSLVGPWPQFSFTGLPRVMNHVEG